MNPFLNPVFTFRVLKHYLTDIKRAWKYDEERLKKYQDRAFKKAVKYAYSVPLYREKYKAAGVHPDDIHGIDDIKKLPLVTKEELINAFPDGIVPEGYKKENAYLVGTSGSSGRPMQMYKDVEYLMIEALGALRIFHAYGINWRKDRITNIGDFSVPTTTDEECLKKGLMKNLSPFHSFSNYQNLYTGEDVKSLIQKIDSFKPDLLIAYTSVLVGLATLKMKGLGKNIKPKYVMSSGEVLDKYTRSYIEDAFNAKVMDVYATTEGGTIAFECPQGKMHINSDFVNVEVLDKNGEDVAPGEFGSIVITRLYPGGTPIIRYTGLNDIVSLSTSSCSCGMHTPIMKNLEGRKKDAVVLPDGRIFPPATVPMPIADALSKFNTKQIKRFQFIQHSMDNIEIRVEIDEERRKEANTEELLEEIRKNYEKLFGEEVKVSVVEKDAITPDGYINPPLVISKVDRSVVEKHLL